MKDKIIINFTKIAYMKMLTYILVISILIISCDDKNCYIQNVYVNEFIDLSLPENIEIKTPGNTIFVDGGVRGIIVYHGVGNNYIAYERNCSYEPCLPCSSIDSVNSGIAYCACCTSAFNVANNGEPLNTPALLPLKIYQSNLNINNNILHVTN